MWIYRPWGRGLWRVGYYSPDHSWWAISVHTTEREAARQVNYLNGGEGKVYEGQYPKAPTDHD